MLNLGINKRNEKNRRRISFLAGCVVGDELFFSAWTDNVFYKMNLETGRCLPLVTFEAEPESSFLYNHAVYYKNTIWLIPAYAQNIAKIDLESLEIQYISLPENGKEIHDRMGIRYEKFKCCYRQDDTKFWLIPKGYNRFLMVDMLTDQIIEFNELEREISFENGLINFIDACYIDNEIWFCPWESEKLVSFNISTNKFRFYRWNHVKEKFRIVKSYMDRLIFLPRDMNQNILFLYTNTCEEKEIQINIDFKEKNDFMYLAADIVDHYIFLVPFLADEYIKIDIQTGEIQTDTNLHEYVMKMEWGPERFQSSIKKGNKIFYTSDSRDMPLLVYDKEKETFSFLEAAIAHEDYEKFLLKIYDKNPCEFLKTINQSIVNPICEEDLPFTLYERMLEIIKKNKLDYINNSKTIGLSVLENVK